MKAMLLAAGRGERLRPLTERVPKALVEVRGKPLIVWQIERLARAGFHDIVINVSHLADAITERLGDGGAWQVRIRYSGERAPLETAGGIAQAREMLGPKPFVLANADVFCEFDFARLRRELSDDALAHLVLVPNPAHRIEGDFSLRDGRVGVEASPRYTYAGLALVSPRLTAEVPAGATRALGPLLAKAAGDGRLTGELHSGRWTDVGTLERLAELEAELASATGRAAD